MFEALYNFIPKQGDHGDQGDHDAGNPHRETVPGWSPIGRWVVPLVPLVDQGDQGSQLGGPPENPLPATVPGEVVPVVLLVPLFSSNEVSAGEGDRADPRARWRSLPADHPGGLCGRFGPATAGALLTACHRWEEALTDDEAAEALGAFNAAADHHLRRIQDADTPR